MRCVQELRGRFGKSVVADVLHGSKSQRIFEFGLESSRTYGALPNDSAARIKEIIEILARGGALPLGWPGLARSRSGSARVQPCHEASA